MGNVIKVLIAGVLLFAITMGLMILLSAASY